MASHRASIVLRPAAPDDLEVLREWDEQPHNIEADPNDDWEWEVELERHPDWREQLMAELDGRPLGFVQIIDPAREETHYWGDIREHLRAIDIWIGAAADLGHGYGTQMMTLALERSFADPAIEGVVIDPLETNVRARKFYERMGFKAVGPRTFGEDRCMVYELSRAEWVLRQAPATERAILESTLGSKP